MQSCRPCASLGAPPHGSAYIGYGFDTEAVGYIVCGWGCIGRSDGYVLDVCVHVLCEGK